MVAHGGQKIPREHRRPKPPKPRQGGRRALYRNSAVSEFSVKDKQHLFEPPRERLFALHLLPQKEMLKVRIINLRRHLPQPGIGPFALIGVLSRYFWPMLWIIGETGVLVHFTMEK